MNNSIVPGSRIFWESGLSYGTVIKKVFNHSAWWYLVRWDSGSTSLVSIFCVVEDIEYQDMIWDMWGLF